jgi:Tol biopolymer transport system component/DNA-binding winged helix-turn-helix (wHTH) protein
MEQNDKFHPSIAASFRLGSYLVRPERNLLVGGDREISLEPRLMQVLVYLAGRPGEVVSRRELKAAIWEDEAMGEDSLNRAVSDIRGFLGDDAAAPRFIETIRKVGYRLVAPVTALPPEQKGNGDCGSPDAGDDKSAAHPRRIRSGRAILVLTLAITCLAVVLSIIVRYQGGADSLAPGPSIPLTNEPGLEVRPALSPDGSRVVFVKKSRSGSTADIYIAQPNAESPLQLTFSPENESYPTWAPDGSQVAFVRGTGESAGIFTVPAIGGEAHCIYNADGFPRQLDWSPDGRWIVFSLSVYDDEHSHLILLDVRRDGQITRVLTDPARGEASDSYPRFSPAGDEVAFERTGTSGLSDIFCVGLDDNRVRRLTRGQIEIWGLDWSPGGDELYFSSFAGGPYSLSAVSIRDLTIRRTPVLSEWVRFPALAPGSRRLVYENRRETQFIMGLSLVGSSAGAAEAEPLLVSNAMDCEPSWSPDGNEIAFISTRSGFRELWVCDGTGSRLRQLTHLGAFYIDSPIWSPDGRHLAFLVAGEEIGVYVIEAIGGTPQRVTPGGHNVLPCSWSRSGSEVYYASDVNGDWQIWRTAPGGGAPLQVTTGGGISAIESPDGETLYLVRPDQDGIWRRPLAGGTTELVVPDFPASHFRSWAVNTKGIFFVRLEGSVVKVIRHDTRSGENDEVAAFPSYPTSRFSISPDGSSLLFVRSDQLDIDLRMLDYLP